MPSPSLPLLQQPSSQIADTRERNPTPLPERVTLWQIEGSLQCSIIGTCLSDRDLLAAIRKHGLPIDRDAQSYDIHSYCVRATTQDCGLARTLNKVLERKYAGAIRLMSRALTPTEMIALWQRLRDSGQIAAGYWAVMSYSHIPTPLRTRVFGEVHMLSHLNGHGATQLATRLSEAEHKCAELEGRLRRAETAKFRALDERDAARRALAAQTPLPSRRAPGASPTAPDRALRRLAQKLAKCERALIVARARARQAELAAGRLAAEPRNTRTWADPRATASATPLPAPGQAAPLPSGHRVLYIGGRAAIVPHLRTAAEARVAAFLHHDGGIEDSLQRIEEMIQGCDAVICPVDCVSHGACRLAKAICQRLNRRFLPIPTASRSGFERALDQLAAEPAPTRNERTP
jgi:hypothetical protein